MSQGVFRDQRLDRQFRQLGFITLPLLSECEVRDLLTYFNSLAESDRNVFTTFASENPDVKRMVDSRLKSALITHFKQLFTYYEPFWGNFFIKSAMGPVMPLHADLQYVNEPDEVSFNIWCALTDTGPHNGALGVVPRSHLAVQGPRGTNVTNGYRKHAEEIRKKLGEVLVLKAGFAVIYDHRLLHWSVANTTSEMRIALTMVGTPLGAFKLHYYAEHEDATRLEKFRITSADDLIRAGFQQRPQHLEPIEVIEQCTLRPLLPEDIPTV